MIDETFIRHIFFQHAKENPTNKANCNRRKCSQTHTYEFHRDIRRTHTNGSE